MARVVVADYGQALERQAELAQMFATNLAKHRGTTEELLADLGSGDPSKLEAWLKRFPNLHMSSQDLATIGQSFAGEWAQTLYGTMHSLQFGATFACTPEIGAWLETAARNIPDTFSLERSDAPAEEGFFWTAATCTARPCVHAYSWRAREAAIDVAVFGHGPESNKLTCLGMDGWRYGVSIGDGLFRGGLSGDAAMDQRVIASNPEVSVFTERVTRFWAATFVFLQQRVFVTTSHTAERHVRRRLERAGVGLAPTVRVVHLRRTMDVDPEVESEYGETVREWHWQWLVRGHWRNQYFPSQRRNRPIFVQPYVKGPKDKPLKPVTTTVYSVDR